MKTERNKIYNSNNNLRDFSFHNACGFLPITTKKENIHHNGLASIYMKFIAKFM